MGPENPTNSTNFIRLVSCSTNIRKWYSIKFNIYE